MSYKLKTCKAAKKRYKALSQGRFTRRKAFKSHILKKKNSTRRRRLSKPSLVFKGDAKRIRILLNS